MRPVVVGVPDSSLPTAALHRAVLEARTRRLPLTVVHGFAAPFGDPPTAESLTAVRQRLRAAVRACSGEDLDVEVVLSAAGATPALLVAAEAAALLVVGGRSRDLSGQHLLGTVSGGCLQAAVCPVMVVPAEARGSTGPGRVVVAVDEGGPSHAALSWAVTQARTSGATLDAVAVCPPGQDPQAVRLSLSRALRGAAGAVRAEDLLVVEGRPVDAIASCLEPDDLLVVGSRGHASLLGLLLASTSAALVARVDCPTVVVRAGQARRELHVRGEGDVGPEQPGRSPLVDAPAS
jgi:nucleotide-binding universal stress UspA family protein